jgi:hypothetical protein
MSKIHYLDSTPDTVRFGIFDAAFPPVSRGAHYETLLRV